MTKLAEILNKNGDFGDLSSIIMQVKFYYSVS